MRIRFLKPCLWGHKTCEKGEEFDMPNEGYAEYLIKTGAARRLDPLDRLDEAVEKDDPNIILAKEEF